MTRSAGQNPPAVGPHRRHMFLDLLDRLVLDQGTDLDPLFEGCAHLDLRHLGRQLLGIGLGDGPLDIDPVGADAGLARVPELALDGLGDGQVQIGVGEDDQGGGPAQFHRHPFQGRGALFGQLAAHAGRAGEGQFADQGAVRQHLADHARLARHDRQGADRQAGLIGELGQGDGRERGLAGRLDHGGAPRCESRSQFARQHGRREVPRGDQGAGPHRLAIGQQQMAQRAVLGLADQPLGLAGEPFDEAVGVGHLPLGLLEGLAVLQGHQGAQAFEVLINQGGPLAQEGRTPVRIAARPVGKGLGGSLDRGVRLCGAQLGDMADHLAGRGVVHRNA